MLWNMLWRWHSITGCCAGWVGSTNWRWINTSTNCSSIRSTALIGIWISWITRVIWLNHHPITRMWTVSCIFEMNKRKQMFVNVAWTSKKYLTTEIFQLLTRIFKWKMFVKNGEEGGSSCSVGSPSRWWKINNHTSSLM